MPRSRDPAAILEICSPIREAMDRQGLGPTELEEITGIAKQSVSQYYRAEHMPSGDKLRALCDALRIDLPSAECRPPKHMRKAKIAPKTLAIQMRFVFDEKVQRKTKVDIVPIKNGFEIRIPLKIAS